MIARTLLEQIQKQSEQLQTCHTSIKNQDAILRRVMNALQLQAMEESVGEDSVSPRSSGELAMDDTDIMRPPPQWDPPGRQAHDA